MAQFHTPPATQTRQKYYSQVNAGPSTSGDQQTPPQTPRVKPVVIAHKTPLNYFQRRESRPKRAQQARQERFLRYSLDQLPETDSRRCGQRPTLRSGTKVLWTFEQTEALEKGIEEFLYDPHIWQSIKNHYPVLNDKDNVALKDKARTERQRRERAGLPLGVWARSSGKGGRGAGIFYRR